MHTRIHVLFGAFALTSVAYSASALAVEGAVDALIDQVQGIVNGLPLIGQPVAGIVGQVDGTLDSLLTPLPIVGGLFGDDPEDEDDMDGNLLSGLGGVSLAGGSSGSASGGIGGSSASTGGSAGAGLLGIGLGGGASGSTVLPAL
jgi:hypothetical protein